MEADIDVSMESLAKYFIGISFIVFIGTGSLVFALSGLPASPGGVNTTASILAPKVGDMFTYDCAYPATGSALSCSTLPAGYVILPRTAYSPTPSRPAGMADAAWALLQKTYANGVCDPNETWSTDPLDCSATGALVNDPYLGRPNAPATVCQQAQRA
ncbi:MAG: hypothetical protein OK452_07825 [Thaumarchaeota archaeon]|nr:hypothetical protein [Nitrososphaerota archaeon]